MIVNNYLVSKHYFTNLTGSLYPQNKVVVFEKL